MANGQETKPDVEAAVGFNALSKKMDHPLGDQGVAQPAPINNIMPDGLSPVTQNVNQGLDQSINPAINV
jgi:hypothetical protein